MDRHGKSWKDDDNVVSIEFIPITSNYSSAQFHKFQLHVHETKSQRVELLQLAEKRMQIGTHGKVGDGEVAYNSQAETHTGNGRK